MNSNVNDNKYFSIIIPVYNSADYLPVCINSILTQTFKDFEVIFVDNNSTDGSRQILDNYAKDNPNFYIITESKPSAGTCRNVALKSARGKYICYIDSDDYISHNMLEYCYKKTDDLPDVLIFGALNYKEDKNKFYHSQYTSKFFPNKFKLNKLFSYHTVCWNKVYKKEFLAENNIRFSSSQIGEEQIFFLRACTLASKINILKKDLYIYRKNKAGIKNNKKLQNNINPIENFYEIENFVKLSNIRSKLKTKILTKYLSKCITGYAKIEPSIKQEYKLKLDKLLLYMQQSDYPLCWWNYFSYDANDNYKNLKLKYVKSMFASIFSFSKLK